MFGTQTAERKAVTALHREPKTGVRAKIKGFVRRVRKTPAIKTPAPSTSIERANAIFGVDMHSILHLEQFFLVSPELKKNANLHTVPFSVNQLEAMFGYTILTITFPSVARIAHRIANDLVIASAISESGRAQYKEQTYPCWQLLMKGDLVPFLEKEAVSRAIKAGLQVVDASLQAYLSAQIIEGKLKKTQESHFVRTVDFPAGINKKIVVSVSKKRQNRIAVKVMKTPTDTPKAIAFVSVGITQAFLPK